jgi:hypothetical protein
VTLSGPLLCSLDSFGSVTVGVSDGIVVTTIIKDDVGSLFVLLGSLRETVGSSTFQLCCSRGLLLLTLEGCFQLNK